MAKQIAEIFRKNTTRVKSIAVHPTNPVVITGHHCGTVNIWNIFYQQVVEVLREHQGSVRSVKIHPYGDIFATAGDDKVVRVWNYKTRQVMHTMKGHTDYIRALDFHPTKPWLVSGSDDGTIKVWNYLSGEQLSSSSGHTHYVMAVLFLDSNHILTGSLDHSIGVWNCSNLFEKKKFMVPDVILRQSIDAHDRGVNSLYMRDGTVVSGSDDREIKIWKYQGETLVLEKVLYNHEGNVTAVFTDGETFYGGGEDRVLSAFTDGKTTKTCIESRIWAVGGRDEYLAVGTDDGLILFRRSLGLTAFSDGNSIYFSLANSIKRYNMNQSIEVAKTKSAATGLFVRDGVVHVVHEDSFELFEDGRKTGGDAGSISYAKGDRYHIKGETMYRNDDVFRSDIGGRLVYSEHGLFVVNGKSFTVILGDQEFSSTFNFVIRSVVASSDTIAVIGANKIHLLDYSLEVLHTISELVEITGGVFHGDILVYATVKQLKYFLGDGGVLQSVESYVIPAMVKDEYLYTVGESGVEKILLNMSEIRFRRAVMEDRDILKVIEEEELPGLSPLEYLIKKNKGGIALPFIKDEEKRFWLFLSDGSYEEALKLATTNAMLKALALDALKGGVYEIAETCFRRLEDHMSLFHLFMATGQLEKMKDLEGEEVENMTKVIFEDVSLLRRGDGAVAEISRGLKRLEVNEGVASVECESGESQEESQSEEKIVAILNDRNRHSKGQSRGQSSDQDSEYDKSSDQDSEDNQGSDQRATQQAPDEDNESKSDNTSKSDGITDLATCNDSDQLSQIFDVSEIDLAGESKASDAQEVYGKALDLTSQGKFTAAIECFRQSIALVALKMVSAGDFQEMRRRIGNYLLGLQVEMARKAVKDPQRSLKMVLFFAGLDLDERHRALVKNLALTACFKYGNMKTAYEIAEENPDCKNSRKILSEPKGEDAYKVQVKYLCYDTQEESESFKECGLCEVKSADGEVCQACKIGILH